MERRLKERLVGATLLLGLMIAVVPEMLSGPSSSRGPPPAASPPQPSRTVTVDLATAQAMSLDEGSSAASQAPASAAEPATATPPDAKVTAPPAMATLEAQPPPAASLENATSSPTVPPAGMAQPAAPAAVPGAVTGAVPDTAHHRWSIQLGSFANRSNAEKLAHRLKARGQEAYVSPIGGGPALRYRVRIGPFADRGSAEQAMSRLRKEGDAASLVAP